MAGSAAKRQTGDAPSRSGRTFRFPAGAGAGDVTAADGGGAVRKPRTQDPMSAAPIHASPPRTRSEPARTRDGRFQTEPGIIHLPPGRGASHGAVRS